MNENFLRFVERFMTSVLTINLIVVSVIALLGHLGPIEYLLWVFAPAFAFILWAACYDLYYFIKDKLGGNSEIN